MAALARIGEAGTKGAGLSGTQRAAALLLLLGETEGAPIWQRLDEHEVKAVSQAMAQLGSLGTAAVEDLVIEFVARLSASGGLSATYESTEALLLKIFPPERVQQIMADLKGSSGRRVWASIAKVDPEVFAAYLAGEYPQTAAVILGRLRPDYAAKVLTHLPEPFAVEALGRLLRLDAVQPEALRQIEETLRVDFVANAAASARPDPHAVMAEVFNGFDKGTEARFMAALEQIQRGSAQRIRERMFTFDDLLKLDAAGVQTLLRTVGNDTLCRALKGVDAETRAFFTRQMSSRAAKNLGDEMASLGPLRLKDVDEAQARMTEAAKDLVERGEIRVGGGAEEEMVL